MELFDLEMVVVDVFACDERMCVNDSLDNFNMFCILQMIF